MADPPAQVMQFLRDLARRARPFAERDLAQLIERLGADDRAASIPLAQL